MVVGLLGNKSPDSNRFTLVTPKPENGVRLQATLGNQNPTSLPVGVVSICIIDNDKVSHIEAIHYGNMEIEYVKDIPSATVTISTYKRNPKYKWIVYDMLTGDVANVTLQLPESAKNQ